MTGPLRPSHTESYDILIVRWFENLLMSDKSPAFSMMLLIDRIQRPVIRGGRGLIVGSMIQVIVRLVVDNSATVKCNRATSGSDQ